MPIPTIARPMQKDDSLVGCPKNASDRRRLRSWVTKIPRPQVSWSTGCGFLLFVRSKGTVGTGILWGIRISKRFQKGVVLGFFFVWANIHHRQTAPDWWHSMWCNKPPTICFSGTCCHFSRPCRCFLIRFPLTVMGSRNFPMLKCLIAGCWFSGQCQKCQRHPKLTSGPSCTHTQILHDFATYLYPNLAEFISCHIFIIKQLLELNRRLPLMVSPLSKLAKPYNSMILELEQCLQLRCLYGCVS